MKTETNQQSLPTSPKGRRSQFMAFVVCTMLLTPLLFLGEGLGVRCFANNIAITNLTLTGQDVINDFSLVQFDVSWNNSWRTYSNEANYDAAWIFVKYRRQEDAPTITWKHATLHYVNPGTAAACGHTEPTETACAGSTNGTWTGGTLITPSDGKGVFLYPNATNAGTGINNCASVYYSNVQLRWDYGADGLADGDHAEICAFAIEMVYVPTGAFYLGDASITSVQGNFSQGNNTTIPFQITAANYNTAITLGGTAATSIYNNNGAGKFGGDDFNQTTTQSLPAAFPKGYLAFYCMKYEITQQQYVDMLNKLTFQQSVNRGFTIAQYRNNIAGSWANYTTSTPYRALGYFSVSDIAAYLDWAALRPMTEMEYEKACRGYNSTTATPNAYIPDEWAAGEVYTNEVAVGCGAGFMTNDGANNEVPALATATTRFGCTNSTYYGPIRVGSFATASTTTRHATGASYYGIMELSGNVWEQVVVVGGSTGRSFTGTHGDGVLTVPGDGTDGQANVGGWPSVGTSSGNNGNTGWGWRGGGYYSTTTTTRVSSRWLCGGFYVVVAERDHNVWSDGWYGGGNNDALGAGGRGIRTAP